MSKLTTTVKIKRNGWLEDDDELLLNVEQWLKYQEILAEKPTSVGTGIAWAGLWIALAIGLPWMAYVEGII